MGEMAEYYLEKALEQELMVGGYVEDDFQEYRPTAEEKLKADTYHYRKMPTENKGTLFNAI